MRLIDGRQHAADISAELAATISSLPVPPTLAVLVPTGDETTTWYVRNIQRAAQKVGVTVVVVDAISAERDAICAHLDALSSNDSIHGIICQTPLPAGVALADVAAHIDPAKDVDGANPLSLGRLAAGLPAYAPAPAAAVLEILEREEVPMAGRHAVVVGRSTVVGKPAALLLLAHHATVTVCHSRTTDLAGVCRQADVMVVAVGQAGLITADFVRPGAVVIDVGTNPTADGSLIGDVDAAGLANVEGALTPVPGGVGPVTTALLLRHTVTAASLAI